MQILNYRTSNIFTFCLIFLNFPQLFGQNLIMAGSFGGGALSEFRACALGPQSYFFAGNFSNIYNIGDFSFINSDNTNNNAVVCSLNESGAPIWAQALMGKGVLGRVSVRAISANAALQRVAITGEFRHGASLGDFEWVEPFNRKTMFVACMDFSGNLAWAFHFQHNQASIESEGMGIAFDDQGQIIVAGKSKGGLIVVNNDSIQSTSNKDIGFVVKFDAINGNVSRAAKVLDCGNESAEINALTTHNNRIYLTGAIKNSDANIGAGQSLVITNSNNNEQYIVFCLDESLNAIWGHTALNGGKSKGISIAHNGIDKVVIVGETNNPVTISENIILSGLSGKKCFIAAFNSNGTPLWAQGPSGSATNTEIRLLSVAASGSTLVACIEFTQNLFWENTIVASSNAKNSGILHFDDLGNMQQFIHFSSDAENKLSNVQINAAGQLSAAGHIRGLTNISGSDISIDLQGANGARESFFYLENNYTSLSSATFPSSFIQLYPNPAGNFLQILLPNSSEQTCIHVYDLQGKLLIKKTIDSSEMLIPVNELHQGIYFCKIKIGENIQTLKFIKL